ncbi:PH domain-containing protein [Brachybacterium huguangmaarense]
MTDGSTVLFRPRLVRGAALAIGVIVLGVTLIAAVLVSRELSPVDGVLFVAFGAAIFFFCWREATVRLEARADAVVVRNLFTTRRLEWPEIIGVSFPQGDPWAHLDLADGETLAVMAIQRSDGERGIADGRRLARLVRERGEARDPLG